MKRIQLALTLTWLTVLFLVPLPFLIPLATGLPTIYSGALGVSIKFGAIAYAWMLAATYLASRPRWLDRLIGLPSMYMIHGVLSILAIVLSFVHHLPLPSKGLAKSSGDLGMYLFIGVGIWSLITMAGWLAARVPVIGRLRHAAERLFNHETNVWLHRLNLVAMALIIVHVHAIDYIYAIKPFIVLFDLATLAVALCYIREKYSQRLHHAGTLQSNVEIAPNVRQLAIQVPTLAKGWQSGDFAFIRFPMRAGMKEYHPFSIVNEPNQQGVLFFAIRGDGDFTRALAGVQAGERVEVTEPFGRYEQFLREHQTNRPVVIYAGGIGVVPLIPTAFSAGRTGRQIRFLYTAKTEADLLYADDLRQWATAPNCELAMQAGRHSATQLRAAMMPGAVYLIAGPAGMLRSVHTMLLKQGVRADDIYSEPFAW